MSYDPETPPSANEMGTLAYALAHADTFAKYIMLRVNGVHSHEAFRRVFPFEWFENANGYARANNVEFNPYVISRLRDALATVDPATLWNPRLAVHEMLSMARDPYAKDSSRLGAMKELNILLNIVVTDENGKSKAGRSLDDFYRDLNERSGSGSGDAAGAETPAQPAQDNPETQTEEGAK